MSKTRYELIIYWSREDQAFLVKIPELPGCMADGISYEEAVASARIVIGEWIETAQAQGRLIPEPRSGPESLPHETGRPLPTFRALAA